LEKINILEKLAPIQDPEMGIGIVDLGLIYNVEVENGKDVKITMTLTTPACPYGPELLTVIEKEVRDMGASKVDIELVWDPPWDPEEMASDEAKDRLGIW
jgi:metal-sulfur cluster biosynthetic enzyme